MPDVWGLAVIAAKFLMYLGILTASGSVFANIAFRVPSTNAFTFVFALLGLAGSLVGFSLVGAALTGDASGMIDPEMLGLLWTTQSGTALAIRFTGLALLIAGFALGRPGLWISALGAVVALWSFATVGHIPDRETFWLQVLLLIHLLAIALWIGILTPLKRLTDSGSAADAASLGRRFGDLATVFVPLLILVGVVMSYVLVGSLTALVKTGYGQVLVAKVLLVAALLSLAAMNKLRFVPKLIAGDADASRHLSRSISFEWLVVAAILLATATLTTVLTLPT